jgi:meso-butanediol dehydrogenase / (S,S)-butanediol dehydrogenase / diacetyl reductase
MGILDGKVAIVTGAGGGIGRAIVTELARHGASVVAADHNEDALGETVEIASAVGDVSTDTADVTKEKDVQGLIGRAVDRYGRLTTMVNNAGVLRPGTILDATIEDYEFQMDVNVRGVFLGCKYAVPAMLESGGGSIINTGSINSVAAEPKLTVYCASKGAVLMLTKAVALDFAPQGVRCNCICPGFVDTKLNVPHYEVLGGREALEEGLAGFQPIARPIEPEEIAGGVVYLASDLSSAVTGTTFLVDGGVTMKA